LRFRRAADIALYTGNDDNILIDLLSDFNFGGQPSESLAVAGSLGGVDEDSASHLAMARAILRKFPESAYARQQITDANSAILDPANQFRGCVPGIS